MRPLHIDLRIPRENLPGEWKCPEVWGEITTKGDQKNRRGQEQLLQAAVKCELRGFLCKNHKTIEVPSLNSHLRTYDDLRHFRLFVLQQEFSNRKFSVSEKNNKV